MFATENSDNNHSKENTLLRSTHDSFHCSSPSENLRDTNVDFEDLIERQAEENVESVVWLDIERKHLDKISRIWTIICIAIQTLVFILIMSIYCLFGIYKFNNDYSRAFRS